MVFKIGDNNFILSNDRIKYNALKREFITLAAWGKDEFKRNYKEKFNNIEEVINGVLEVAKEVIDDAVLRGCDALIKEKVNFSEEEFKQVYYEKYYTFQDTVNTFLDGNYTFKNPNTLALFLNAIGNNILKVHELVAIYILNDYPHAICKPLTKEDYDRFEEIYKDLGKNEDRVIDLLKANPYDKRAFIYIFKTFGDENKEVESLCKMLDVDFTLIKREVVDEKFNSLDFSTEEGTIESKKIFNEFINYIGYDNVYEYLKAIEDKLIKFNYEFCTVNGFEFETREEATIAREEKAFIEENLSIIKEEIEKELVACKERILGREFKTEIKDKYLEQLEKRISQSIYNGDDILLNESVDIEEIKTEDEAIKALEKVKGITIRTEELYENKLNEIKNKKTEIIEQLDKAKVEDVLNSYLFLNIERVYEAIEEIADMDVRTEWVKEKACELLSEDGELLVKEHLDLLGKAKRYEERQNLKKEIKKEEEEKGVFSFFKKFLSDKLEEYDKNKEEAERESWEFITDGGKRSLEDIE